MAQYMSAGQQNAINRARARALAGLQDFYNNNISTLNITIGNIRISM